MRKDREVGILLAEQDAVELLPAHVHDQGPDPETVEEVRTTYRSKNGHLLNFIFFVANGNPVPVPPSGPVGGCKIKLLIWSSVSSCRP